MVWKIFYEEICTQAPLNCINTPNWHTTNYPLRHQWHTPPWVYHIYMWPPRPSFITEDNSGGLPICGTRNISRKHFGTNHHFNVVDPPGSTNSRWWTCTAWHNIKIRRADWAESPPAAIPEKRKLRNFHGKFNILQTKASSTKFSVEVYVLVLALLLSGISLAKHRSLWWSMGMYENVDFGCITYFSLLLEATLLYINV